MLVDMYQVHTTYFLMLRVEKLRSIDSIREVQGSKEFRTQFYEGNFTICFCKEVSRKFYKFNENILNIFYLKACICDITLHS